MNFTLKPAAPYALQLNGLIMEATSDIANEWFFYDGAHSSLNTLEHNFNNTWLYENIVAINEQQEIFAYFEGQWQRPMDVIKCFRAIHFGEKYSFMAVKAFLIYLDYLFVNRGCMAFNWTVAHQNTHAMVQYERFVQKYCGHVAGTRHHAQKSYTGKISNITLYEITREEYFEWRAKHRKE